MSRLQQWKDGDLFKPLFSRGATVYHHGLLTEGGRHRALNLDLMADQRRFLARKMIAERYQGATDLQLKIHAEIASGSSLEATKAGRWLRYGHTKDTQPGGERSSSPSPDSEHNPGDTDEDGGGSSSWGAQFVSFFKDPDRIMPWARLLFQAFKMYANANGFQSPSEDSFSGDCDDENEFCVELPFYEGEIPLMFPDDDGDPPEIIEQGSWWNCLIQ
jgi:hypothetical protein